MSTSLLNNQNNLKCAVCDRRVQLGAYFSHVKLRHPKTAMLSQPDKIIVDKEELHNFREISRIAIEIHRFRYSGEKLDPEKLKNF